jgi:uncharacterized protein
MANNYKTPGVYVREISLLPPSIAAVETAIPAFIGHTEIAKENLEDDLRMKPFKIGSMLEYELYFGGPQPETNIVVTVDEQTKDPSATRITGGFDGERSKHIMFYAMQAFFANGGGDCYIVSIGGYNDIGVPLDANLFTQGLDQLNKEDEVTLIVFPESRGLDTINDFASLQDRALAQCADLQDRFAVMDVYGNSGNINADANAFRSDGVGLNNLKYGAAYYPVLETTFDYAYEDENVAIAHLVDGAAGPFDGQTLDAIQSVNNVLFAQVSAAVRQMPCLLPPSPLMVGVYAAVDNSRGVWKAPANVSLNSVIRPTIKISDKDQESLNIDINAGKSINAIRAFQGKGTLVWGARTLAGNDNEWRYIPVRRFFNFVEESVKKATEPFVFEPNDANTWVKVRAMIENFLTLQWRAGALQGVAPEDSFFVRVGLGETMTALDILEGRMNVSIGMAVVRPAEFIILTFSHQMAEG